MMAVKSNLINMTVCLTVTCLLCSSVLGGVYALTFDPIARTKEKILKAAIGKVLPEGGEISDRIRAEVGGLPSEYYTCTRNGRVLAYAVRSQTIGFGGPLTLMVGVLADGTVYDASVLSHSETPGLGAKCTDDGRFLSQWRGFNPKRKKLSVAKDGGDVDAITAATITSRAYTLAVRHAVEAVEKLVRSAEEAGAEAAAEPAAAGSTATELAAVGPTTTEQTTIEPNAAAEPAAAEPAEVGPTTTEEPTAAGPTTTEPVVAAEATTAAEPAVVGPATTEPTATEPAAAEPDGNTDNR